MEARLLLQVSITLQSNFHCAIALSHILQQHHVTSVLCAALRRVPDILLGR